MKTHLRLAVILETFPKKEEQREFDGSAKNKNRETKTERRAKKKTKTMVMNWQKKEMILQFKCLVILKQIRFYNSKA